MSYKFDRGRFPPRDGKRFRAVPRAASSSQQAAYFCRIQCPVVGVGLVGGFMCVLQILRQLSCFVGGQGGVDGVGAEDYAV